jgi:hypothetical protein
MDIRIVEDGATLHLLVKDITEKEKNDLTSLLKSFSNKEITFEKNKDIQSISNPNVDLPPFFLETSEEVSSENETNVLDTLGNHVVNMGKYQGKGFTIKEIFEKDFEWMEFTSTHSKQEDAKKMKEFLAIKNK